jgi:hypothetical protein
MFRKESRKAGGLMLMKLQNVALARYTVVAGLLAYGSAAGAQSVTATATITPTVTTQVLNNLDLGSMAAGAGATVAPSGAVSAQVEVTYNTGTVDMTMPASVTLSRGAGGTLSVTLSCAGAYTSNAATTTPCTTNTFQFMYDAGGGSVTALSKGYFYIGGSISASATQGARPGTYTGTITVTTTNSSS